MIRNSSSLIALAPHHGRVMWIGLLYYQLRAGGRHEGGGANGRCRHLKHVAPRALLYFRWAAAVTWPPGKRCSVDIS